MCNATHPLCTMPAISSPVQVRLSPLSSTQPRSICHAFCTVTKFAQKDIRSALKSTMARRRLAATHEKLNASNVA